MPIPERAGGDPRAVTEDVLTIREARARIAAKLSDAQAEADKLRRWAENQGFTEDRMLPPAVRARLERAEQLVRHLTEQAAHYARYEHPRREPDE